MMMIWNSSMKTFKSVFNSHALLLCLFFLPIGASAFHGFGTPATNTAFTVVRESYFGYVYTRTLVEEEGSLQWVQYNDEGKTIEGIQIAAEGDYKDAIAMSVVEYKRHIDRYESRINDFEQVIDTIDNPQTLLVSESDFKNSTYLDLNGQEIPSDLVFKAHNDLADNTRWILLVPQALRDTTLVDFDDNYDLLVAAEFPVNPVPTENLDGGVSLLVKETTGDIIPGTVAEWRWGYLTAFYQDMDTQEYLNPENTDSGWFRSKRPGARILQPLEGVLIESIQQNSAHPAYRQPVTSNEDGFYRIVLSTPWCPRGYYSIPTQVTAKLSSKSFNPELQKRGSHYPYWVKRNGYVSCNGLSASPTATDVPMGTKTLTPRPMDFQVDITVLSGKAGMVPLAGQEIPEHLQNEAAGEPEEGDEDSSDYLLMLEEGCESSVYTASADPLEEAGDDFFDLDGDDTQDFDFDHDGQPDTVVKGTLQPVLDENDQPTDDTYFVKGSADGLTNPDAPSLWGVFLAASGTDPEADQPDFTKVMDLTPNLNHEGLLAAICYDDMKNTDLYVVRVADGSVLSERLGLNNNDIRQSDLANDVAESVFTYRTEIRGTAGFFGGKADARLYESDVWQSNYGLDVGKYDKREADHLKPGEQIKIYAINRATGYLGSITTTVEAHDGEDTVSSGSAGLDNHLYFEIDPIEMHPPNLKIWAERKYTPTHGLSNDEEQEYLIGSEGAALESDTSIYIHTEWLDHDGSSLPSGIPGFTGRMVRLVADKTLPGADQNLIEHFEIEPGRHLEVLDLPQENSFDNQHFYVQVSGEPVEKNATFMEQNTRLGQDKFEVGEHSGKLANRPSRYVPFKVPVYDERISEWRMAQYEKALADNPESTLPKPKAYYRDLYRPELQFTIYDLEVDAINRHQGEEETDILDSEQPVIASSDDLISLLYEITLANDFEPLDYLNLNDEKELIFALGEQEVKATVGGEQQVTFDNLSHLASLSPEDFLSLRLYTNNDSANILWEYAFQYLTMEVGVDPIRYADEIYVNADDPGLELSAFLYGTGPDEEKNWHSYQLVWKVAEGDAQITPAISNLKNGTARATLNVAPFENNVVTVTAELAEFQDTKVFSQKIRVLNGMPASVVVTSASGDVYEQGIGQRDITVRLFDANSNPLKGGIPVSFMTEGGAYISNQVVTTDNDGYASATVKGSYDSGAFPIDINAGTAETVSSVTVNPISINFNSMPSSLVGGNVYDLSIEATASSAAPDAFVQLGATGAILEQQSFKTDANGLLSYKLHVPPKGGDIRLSARTGVDTVVYETLQAQPKAEDLYAERTFIISSQQDAQYEALQTDQVTIKGNEGQSWSLGFDPYHFPNRAPLYLNRFFDLRNDDAGLYAAQYSAWRSSDKPAYGFYSVNFVENDTIERNWRLPYVDALGVNYPGISFWLKVEGDGTILSTSDNRIELTVNSGALSVDIATVDGTIQLSQNGITTGVWHQVALGLNGTQAYLAVDGLSAMQSSTSSINWNAQVGEPWLTLGDKPNSASSGFEGKISGLRLYDWNTPALVSLSQSNGVFDSSGAATINVVSSGQEIPVNMSVGLSTGSGENLSINLLPWDNFDRYQQAVTRALGSAETLADNVTLSPLFPTGDQPLESLHATVSARDDTGPLEAVLVATAWLGMRNEISVIEPHIAALQDHYANFGDQQLVFSLADELAQAISEARAGNNMRLITMRTGLLVWGELLAESPSAAQFIGSAIQNKTDLWTWLRYMSLPANGWAGSHIPIPKPENTCDKVSPTVNVGTIMEYSDVPCRATGAMVAEAINNWIAEDEELITNHRMLTRYIEIMTAGLEGAPLEMTKLVFAGTQATVGSNWLPVQEAHANPLVMAARLMVFALKTGAKAGFATAPQNLINFFRNRTNSRFNSLTLLSAIAYLESRREDGPFQCEGCDTISPEVFGQIDNNIVRWFNGLSLSKDGDIVEDEKPDRKLCTLSNQAHGAALELVGTAAYHALFEFAERDDLEILASDKYMVVPLRQKGILTDYSDVGSGNYGRQPDLILAGNAEEQRYWIEFKSWSKGEKYVKSGKLNSSFKAWDLARNVNGQFKHAHKQHFLDYATSRGKLRPVWADLAEFYPNNKEIDRDINLELRAKTYRTWIQTWEQYDKAREYQVFKKEGKKWKVANKTIPVYRHRPWINKSGVITDTDITVSDFDLLQNYLTQAPDRINNDGFEVTIGYKKSDHWNQYGVKQVGKNNSTVAPFTLKNMMVIEVGDAIAKQTIDQLSEQIANSEFANYLGGGELSAEQIAALRSQVEAKVLENMGVVGDVLETVNDITPDWWLSIEESLQDAIAGAIGDDARDMLANFEVPELLEGQLCEVYEQ